MINMWKIGVTIVSESSMICFFPCRLPIFAGSSPRTGQWPEVPSLHGGWSEWSWSPGRSPWKIGEIGGKWWGKQRVVNTQWRKTSENYDPEKHVKVYSWVSIQPLDTTHLAFCEHANDEVNIFRDDPRCPPFRQAICAWLFQQHCLLSNLSESRPNTSKYPNWNLL